MRTPVIVGLVVATCSAAHGAYQHVEYDAGTGALGSPFTRFDASHFANVIPTSPYFGLGYSPSDQNNGSDPYFSGTTDSSKYTFWYLDTLTLDAAAGVELSARLKVGASNIDGDRAGVAMALTDSGNQYTELYIGTDRIFLNGNGRTHTAGDEFLLNTQAEFHDYVVRIQGASVTVLVDGLTVLSGATFDANLNNAPTLANWAVLGDITQSAAGSYYLESVAVTVVPEPVGVAMCGMALPFLLRRSRRS